MLLEKVLPKVDCLSLLFKNSLQADLFKNNNQNYASFFSFKPCACVSFNDENFSILCKISFDDILQNVYPDQVFDTFLSSFDFLFEKIKSKELSLIRHVEIAIDLNLDFEEHFHLFKSLLLYYNTKVKGQKAVLITDLKKSIKSGLSVKRKNIQLVIYNKQLEVLKNNYTISSSPLTRIEFRFFNLNEPFSDYAVFSRFNYFLYFFSIYNQKIFNSLEIDLAENLFNNFKKEKDFYLSNIPEIKKFSIKNFLIANRDFCLSKNTIRLFYQKLKDEKIVVGSFDNYFFKVLSDYHFSFIESKNLEYFFDFLYTSSI